jgi:hypothetical protein
MTRVSAVRSFIGRRRRRSWIDWYCAGFAAVIALLYLADLLTGPLSRLSGVASLSAAGHPATQSAAAQAVAGTGLVIGAAAGLLLLAQALGPLALSPADASWLLLSPLNRRGILRRSATGITVLSALTGALLGVLALAMAGPFLRPGSRALPSSWLELAALAGAGFSLAAVQVVVLVQPHERYRVVVRACCGVVALIAMAAAVAGDGWTAVSHAITSGFGGLTTSDFGTATVVALVLAVVACIFVWLLLARFPAGVLRTDSARAGRTLTAAAFLNLQLLTWIAEDNYWRGRLLPSRRWPKLPPAMVLAWADWRRLGRRPATLCVIAASSLAPALVGAAITGHGRGYPIAAVLLAGAIAAAAQGTAASKRDLNDPALRRLLGVDASAALAARAVLPALLAAVWLALSFVVLAGVGVLHGWLWPLAGFFAGPGVAAAALRMARTAPINPTEEGPNTALGSTPPWMMTRVLSIVLAIIAAYPVLKAIHVGQLHAATIVAQIVLSAIVLGGYLLVTDRGTVQATSG